MRPVLVKQRRGEPVLAVVVDRNPAKRQVIVRRYVGGAWSKPTAIKQDLILRPLFALTRDQRHAVDQLGLSLPGEDLRR